MAKISFPLKEGQRGASVANLHEALAELLKRGTFTARSGKRAGVTLGARREMEATRFGPETRKLVVAFQEQHALPPAGTVDAATAAALDVLIASDEQAFRPWAPVYQGASGPDVALVQMVLSSLGYSINQTESDARRYGATTAEAVSRWRSTSGLAGDGGLDAQALAELARQSENLPQSAHGTIRLTDGSPARGLLVVAIDRDFRDEHVLGECRTDDQGGYHIVYTAADLARSGKSLADLGIKVFTADGKNLLSAPTGNELVISAAGHTEISLAVAIPEGGVLSEFARIGFELRKLTGSVPVGSIGAGPTDDDSVLLARKTGFDVGRIVHFVIAERLRTLTELSAEYFYALLHEDGLYGITPDRPRAMLAPVGLRSDTRAVLYEAVLIDEAAAKAALDRAVRKHVVGPAVRDEAAKIRVKLKTWAGEARDFCNGAVSRNILAGVDGMIDSGHAEGLADVLTSLDLSDAAGLFAALDAKAAFAPAARDLAKSKLELAALLDFNFGLLDDAAARAGAGGDLRSLARLQRKDWSALLTKTAKVTSKDAKVSAATVRRQASTIVRRFEKAFPTVAIAAQLGRSATSTLPAHHELAALLDANPDLDLKQHRLVPFLKAAGTDPATISPEVMLGAEKLQRMFQLTGDLHRTEALIGAGYSASADIVAAGREQFVLDAKTKASLSKGQAEALYRTAENTNIAALSVATALKTLSWPTAMGGPSAVAYGAHIEKIVAEQPDIASLFGNAGVCACDACCSIYGPAAYFADVMRFMRSRLVLDKAAPALPGTRVAKDILFARRPDLGEIDLNCDNALIEVPHIDIVCELAEEAISPDPGLTFAGPVAAGPAPAALLAAIGTKYEIGDEAIVYGPYAPDRFMVRDKGITVAIDGPGPNWTLRRLRQTHGTAEERAAAPEYVNADAYVLLAAGKAAFGLPFDLFHEETCALLATAGIERAALMDAMASGGSPSADEIAAEKLGLSAGERALIVAAAVAAQPVIWAVVGTPAAATMVRLDVFTNRTGLEYEGVERLIAGRFVKGGVDLFIRHNDSSCSLAKKEIVNLDDVVLDRVHRVLRLARKTGLAPADVDRLAAAPKLGGNALDDLALKSLAQLAATATELQLDVPLLIDWLDKIPADGDSSKHQQLFQNPTVTGKLADGLAAGEIAKNDADEAAIAGSAPKLATVTSDIALAFGARIADIQALEGRLADALVLGPNPPLTSTALAAIYGRLGLARALGLSAVDLVALERLANVDPLASPARLRDFTAIARSVALSGFAVADLAYLLERNAINLAARDLSDGAITPVLKDLQTRLIAAIDENKSVLDPALAPGEQVNALETLLGRQPQLSTGAVATLLNVVRSDAITAAMANLAKVVVDADPALPVDGGLGGQIHATATKAAIDALVIAATDANRIAFLKLVMDGLAETATNRATVDLATRAIGQMLDLADDRAAEILRGARLAQGALRTPLIELLTSGDIAAPATSISPAATPDLYRALRLAYTVKTLVAPFEPSAATLAFMLANSAALGWMALDGTPFETTVPALPSVALADFLALADTFRLIEEYPAVRLPAQLDQTVDPTQILLLAAGGGAKPPLLDALAVMAGWPRDVLGDADARLALPVDAYKAADTWRKVARLVGMLIVLRVPLATAVGFIAPALTDSDRRSARTMLRARYAAPDWLPALKAIMDPIREKKRDALGAHLLATNPDLTSKADLYDYFLTDTEWSSKMPSSRLVHAHGTLQLFLQRCLGGLEPKATADLDHDPDWKLWDWMKNYRVWEVNRKVFVEAQYYIRPEWRDDKTEPFAAMETQVLQKEITPENIKDAFEGYLDGLDEIAFVDVLATCYDFDREELHVFGATKGGDPRSYFHRTFQRERVWTAWTKIDLDIAGEHLIGFFRNKRLYLAWATFMERGNDQQQAVFPVPGAAKQSLPPAERWSEIRLAVSEYTGKKWLPRRLSEGVVTTPVSTAALDQETIFLTVTPAPTKFTVDVCRTDDGQIRLLGGFLLTGCKGYPEAIAENGTAGILMPAFEDTAQRGQRLVEKSNRTGDQLAIMTGLGGSGFDTLFTLTPGIFRVTYPYQASEIDRLLSAIYTAALGQTLRDRRVIRFFGLFMPYFFEDNQRGYVLIPGFYGPLDAATGTRKTQKTFSNIRRLLVDFIALVVKYLGLLAAATTTAEKQAVLDQLAADGDLAALIKEVQSYRGTEFGLVVRNFYHPLACRLREHFFQGGIPELLSRNSQLEVGEFKFEDPVKGYAPSPIILPPYPRPELEFGRDSAYGVYNWELTFHAPHLIATKLMEAEQFDEAETWLRYIFDPLGSSNDPEPARYWNTKPFFLRSATDYGDQVVSEIMDRLAKDPQGAIETELADTVLDWRRNPFKPYLVARGRPVAFQQAIVDLTARMFIGRGDQHFRRDTLEELVLASLDYSRADRLLGQRVRIVPPAVPVPPETYNQLESKLDLFGNALRKIENLLPDLSALPHGGSELPPPPLSLESLYFCIPPSDKLFELWDLLDERQANLRNSRTIDGVERSLSLFAPPLSVEELIAATAAGLSVSAIISGMSAPKPPYRFKVMLRHAIELADIASSFNHQMEQAIATSDSEGLARLKVLNEGFYLDQQTNVLREEIKAAGGAIAAASKARQMHSETEQFYANRPYMNPWEIAGTATAGVSLGLQAVMAIGYIAAGGLSLIPKFMVGAAGFGGSPTANAQTGGDTISQAARDVMVGAVNATAGALDKATQMLDKQASYLTRKEDWGHLAANAGRERERADIDIAVAGIRETIAKEQLRLHSIRQQQSAAELTYLKGKFSNSELFEWIAQQMRGLSRQMYNRAFEAATATQRCYNYDLGVAESFVRPGQWNDNRRGLLAAENLTADLRQMETAHFKRNVREREITKHVSLARLDPLALLALRTTGRCTFQLPEAIFDLDHPGHYFRRIKSLSVTVPCVAGPYASVPIKLTQASNRLRFDTRATTGAIKDFDKYVETADDPRFKYNVGSIETIETSRGEDDAGLFNLDLNDERYLPFEGNGLCGTFVAELPPTLRPFDYHSVTDLVLIVRYTARDRGGAFRKIVANGLREGLNVLALGTARTGLFQAVDVRRDRPDDWYRLTSGGTSSISFGEKDLPYFTTSHGIDIPTARVLVRVTGAPSTYAIKVGGSIVNLAKAAEPELDGLLSASVGPLVLGAAISLEVAIPSLIEEMTLLVNYKMNS